MPIEYIILHASTMYKLRSSFGFVTNNAGLPLSYFEVVRYDDDVDVKWW